jgi:hypothetical protein
VIKQKMYEVIRAMLQDNLSYRDNDKKLIWAVWVYELGQDKGYITRNDFLELSCPETIRRTRQKVQESYPNLGASQPVEKARGVKRELKGNFIFQEPVTYGTFGLFGGV